MACLELDGRILIIDVGLSFPSGDMPGIDLVLPDFDFVRRHSDRIEPVRRAQARPGWAARPRVATLGLRAGGVAVPLRPLGRGSASW